MGIFDHTVLFSLGFIISFLISFCIGYLLTGGVDDES